MRRDKMYGVYFSQSFEIKGVSVQQKKQVRHKPDLLGMILIFLKMYRMT